MTDQPQTQSQELTHTSVEDLKLTLFKQQQKNLIAYLGSEEKANKFLGAVVYCFSSIPKLAECTQASIVNAFMKCAELDIFPSNVSGQAYILPYDKNVKQGEKWIKIPEAQFQLGYQGLVTLFYRAGAKAIRSEIVKEIDVLEGRYDEVNGIITHRPNRFDPKRNTSPAVGAYVIVDLPTGWSVSKAMGKEEIFAIRDKFSKGKDATTSPWKETNDPQLWMWKKTVLKQLAKLVPKNERIMQAIEYDNEGDTDFEEIHKDIYKTQALRPTEKSLSEILPEPTHEDITPPKKEPEPAKEPEKAPDNTPSPAEQWQPTSNSATSSNEPKSGTKLEQQELPAQG